MEIWLSQKIKLFVHEVESFIFYFQPHLSANSSFDGVVDLDFENSVVNLIGIQFLVDEQGHLIGENEQVSIFIDLK